MDFLENTKNLNNIPNSKTIICDLKLWCLGENSIFKTNKSRKKLDPIKQSTLENESLLKSFPEDKKLESSGVKRGKDGSLLLKDQNYLTP